MYLRTQTICIGDFDRIGVYLFMLVCSERNVQVDFEKIK